MNLRKNIDQFNIKRKMWHLLGLIIPLLLYMDIFRFIEPENPDITRKIGFIMILIFFIFIIIIEVIRLRYPPFNEFFISKVGSLMKESEYNKIHGSVSYILANVILFFFFTKEIIILSSLVLMVSDPIAAYFGIFYGKHKFFKQKTLEGFFAFFISSIVIGILFLIVITYTNIESPYSLNDQNYIFIVLIIGISSFFTSIVELLSFTTLYGLIDDNLTIPLSFAISFSILSYIFQLPLNTYISPLQF